MRQVERLILIVIISAAFIACKKKGCTDCNAVNYDSEAKKDDNSCLFVNDDLIGVYAVQDSITGPPSMEWSHQSYNVEVSRANCAPNNLIFSNYANKNHNANGTIYSVDCKITDDNISISEQDVNQITVRNSSGHFSNDSIFFDIEYENEFGEVFYGKCYGSKL